MQHRRTLVWPELKKARLERRTLVFIDEAGSFLLPALVRTYAPSDKTPILKARHVYDHLSAILVKSLLPGFFDVLMYGRRPLPEHAGRVEQIPIRLA